METKDTLKEKLQGMIITEIERKIHTCDPSEEPEKIIALWHLLQDFKEKFSSKLQKEQE